MLEKIEERDAELTGHRQHLEEIVQKRTEELIRLNKDLTHNWRSAGNSKGASRNRRKNTVQFSSIPGNASIIIEEDGIISLANEEFARLTGYELSEVIGKMPWTDFVHPDYVDRMMEYHALRRMGRDVPSKYDFKIVRQIRGSTGCPSYCRALARIIQEHCVHSRPHRIEGPRRDSSCSLKKWRRSASSPQAWRTISTIY